MSRGRRFVAGFCHARGVDDGVIETAVLLTSELVTNALRHAGGPPVLRAEVSRDTVRVSVADESRTMPVLQTWPAHTAEGGRGLLLVSELAAQWGVTHGPDGGKAVWFELGLGA